METVCLRAESQIQFKPTAPFIFSLEPSHNSTVKVMLFPFPDCLLAALFFVGGPSLIDHFPFCTMDFRLHPESTPITLNPVGVSSLYGNSSVHLTPSDVKSSA